MTEELVNLVVNNSEEKMKAIVEEVKQVSEVTEVLQKSIIQKLATFAGYLEEFEDLTR